jgi:sulfur carrier protein
MLVIVNGERRELPPEATVLTVVEQLVDDRDRTRAPAGRGMAVAVDGEVVPRDGWSSRGLDEGARVEVLAAIQGGAQ